jgi:hypothetical protein
MVTLFSSNLTHAQGICMNVNFSYVGSQQDTMVIWLKNSPSGNLIKNQKYKNDVFIKYSHCSSQNGILSYTIPIKVMV